VRPRGPENLNRWRQEFLRALLFAPLLFDPALFDPPLLEPLLLDDDPPLFEEDPPLLEEDDPPLLEEDDPPLFDDEPPDDPPLFDDEPPPLLEPLLLDDEPPPLLLDPLLLDPLLFDDEPPLFDAVLREPDDEPPLLLLPLLRDEDEPLVVPPERDEDLREPPDRLAAPAAAAPSAAPAAAPAAVASGDLRREVLRCSFSPRPALKLTVVRSGILISVPVRGLRPVREARVRRVNFPKPGMDSDPAACTASEMAPDAVSKIASTTRAAAALVSSALSATASMNSDLFMIGSPSGAEVRRGPSAPNTPHARSVPLLARRFLASARIAPRLPPVEPRAEAVHHLPRRVGRLPESLLSAFAVRL